MRKVRQYPLSRLIQLFIGYCVVGLSGLVLAAALTLVNPVLRTRVEYTVGTVESSANAGRSSDVTYSYYVGGRRFANAEKLWHVQYTRGDKLSLAYSASSPWSSSAQLGKLQYRVHGALVGGLIIMAIGASLLILALRRARVLHELRRATPGPTGPT